MARKIMIIVATVIAVSILFTMFAEYIMTYPEEHFKELRENVTLTTTESWHILRNKSVELLEHNGFLIEDSFINAYFDEVGNPMINLTALVIKNNSKEIKTFKIETDYDSSLTLALLNGLNKIYMHNNFILYICDYLREINYIYDVVGERIVLY